MTNEDERPKIPLPDSRASITGMAKVALFVTCIVDMLFPDVGEAALDILESQGLTVEFPEAQTCCGQPAFNSGFNR